MAQTYSDTPEQKPSGSLLRKILVILIPIFIIIGFIALAIVMNALKKKPEVKKRRNPVLAVMATEAYSDSVVLDVVVQGQSRPRTEIDIVPQVGGKITYVSPQFVAGGTFRKGETLLRIEEADYNVGVLRSEAGVARARQVVMREKAESDIARRDWEELGGGTEPTDLTLRKPQMAEAEAGLQSAMADLDNAKLQLSRTQIIAPFDGRIRERFVDIGQFVAPGARLARVFSTNVIEVPLSLTDADLTRLDLPLAYSAKNRDDAPDVTLSAIIRGKRRYWSGKIVRTDGTYNPQTRALSAIAEVVDPFGKGAAEGGYPLAPGLFVDAEIEGKSLEQAIIIPRDALRPEDKVYVVDDKGVASSRDAVVIDTNASRAVLASGVEPGELIITSPLEKSQISLTFRVLDASDPTTVLVEPPEVEEVEKPDEEADEKSSKKTKKKSSDKGDDDAGAGASDATTAKGASE